MIGKQEKGAGPVTVIIPAESCQEWVESGRAQKLIIVQRHFVCCFVSDVQLKAT